MRKILATLGTIGFVLLMLVATGAGHIGGKIIGGLLDKPSKEEILTQLAATINKGLPTMVDAETRLNSAKAAQGGTTMAFSYTMVNYLASQLSAADLITMRRRVVDRTCSMYKRSLLAKRYAVEYRYESKDGLEILDFSIRPNQQCLYDPYAKRYVIPR